MAGMKSSFPRFGLALARIFLQALLVAAATLTQTDTAAAPLQVVNRFLRDSSGNEAMIRGVNVPVYKSGYADDLDAVAAAVASTKANAVRLEWWANPHPTTTQYSVANLDRAIQKYADLGILPIVELHDLTYVYNDDLPGGASNSQTVFANTITAFWTRADVLPILIKHQDHLVINLANEWGSSTWRDGSSTAANFIQNYTAAITAMRNAGINVPLMVDAPKGFEYAFILANGQAIVNADPQHNVLLSVHAYWEASHYSDDQVNAILDAVKNSGLPIVIGEASSNAWSDIPCDPIHYANLLTRANANRIGYLIWAWYEDGQCGQNMNITRSADGVTLPTSATPGFGYDVLYGSGYGIDTALPLTKAIIGKSRVLTPGRAIASWPAGIPPAEKRPVLVFLPGWGGSGAVEAAVSAQNTNLLNEGYVTLAIGFDSTQQWISDIEVKTLQGLDKLCADATIPADCGAIGLMGESYGGAQNYWVIEYLRGSGYDGGGGSKGRALAFLSEDTGYGPPGTVTDPATGAFVRAGLANTAAYSIAMIQNLGDGVFPVDSCAWGNCGARAMGEAHLARGDQNVFSICPPGGDHGTRGFADWSRWVVSAVKTMIHGTQGIPTFTGYTNPTLLVANACVQQAIVPPLCSLSASPPSIASGSASTLTATCSPAATSFVWTGGTCAGNTTATCTVTPTATTTYSVTGSNGAGAGNTAAATVTVIQTPGRVVGIATRMQVLTGDNVMIAGFIIGGATPKTVVVRARGPSLGMAGALADPTLTIVPAAGGASLVNDDWQIDGNAAALAATGFAPGHSKDSAIMRTFAPGAYTAIVAGAGNTSGIAIVEVYEIDHPELPLLGIATRGFVRTGDDVMIGGFIIQGAAPQTVVIRARGPSMNIAGALLDPVLTLVPAGGGPTLTNDNWQTDANAAALAASGMAPTHPNESALLVTLNPGAYTAIVSGAGGSTGIAIAEVFAR